MTTMDDPTFRSQEFAENARQQGQQAYNQSLTAAANSATETVRYLNDLGMRKQELAMRQQAFEMERAINQRKLQEMMSVDLVRKSRLEAEMMEEQVKAQQAQTAHLQQQTEMSKKTMNLLTPEEMRASAMDKHNAEIAKELEAGTMEMVNGIPQRVTDQARLEASLEKAAERKKRALVDQSSRDVGALSHLIDLRMQQLDQAKTKVNSDKSLTPDQKKQLLDQIEEERAGLSERTAGTIEQYGGHVSGKLGQQSDDLERMKQGILKGLESYKARKETPR